MQIDISDNIIAVFNEENAGEYGDQNGNLTKKRLTNMVEDLLADYFS